MQGAQFINNTSKRPNIAFLIVLLVVDLLRRHIVGCSDMRECKLRLIVEHASQTEVSQLHVAIEIQEDVARFQITVQNFLRQVVWAGTI